MTYLAVLPSIYEPYTEACLNTCRFDRIQVVHNTPTHNRGVAGSWNLAARKVLTEGLDWLVIFSAGLRFGPPGGLDFVAQLADHAGELAVEADHDLGWHLIAFPWSTLAKVGLFCEDFWPAYNEDNDYSYRIQLAYGIDARAPDFVGPLWPKVPVDAELWEVAHGIKRGGVTVDFVGLEELYVQKWGGKSGEETYTEPYGGTR